MHLVLLVYILLCLWLYFSHKVYKYTEKSFSQFGQDLWVLENIDGPGFFVEVGAHHGTELSNTKLLEMNGWSGLCIEPFPSGFEDRSAKVVKDLVYSKDGDILEFKYAKGSGLSGIDKDLVRHKDSIEIKNAETVTLRTKTLETIFTENNVPQNIDYLSIDTEGSEFEILKVFPFNKYNIKCITVEHNHEEPKRSQLNDLLVRNGFILDKSVDPDDWYIKKTNIRDVLGGELLKLVCQEYNITPTGIIHIGAHLCEERSSYIDLGLTDSDIIWIEGNTNLVNKNKDTFKNINIYDAIVSDIDGKDVEFILTTNDQANSILEFGEIVNEHPDIKEINRIKKKTITLPTLLKGRDIKKYNCLVMDIQCAELLALKGMTTILKNFDCILTEVNTKQIYNGCGTFNDIVFMLKEYDIIPTDVTLTEHGWGDAVFIKRSLK